MEHSVGGLSSSTRNGIEPTKYTRIASAMRLDDAPDGVTMGVERCRGFHQMTPEISQTTVTLAPSPQAAITPIS